MDKAGGTLVLRGWIGADKAGGALLLGAESGRTRPAAPCSKRVGCGVEEDRRRLLQRAEMEGGVRRRTRALLRGE